MSAVTVVIPTIAPRADRLRRAVASVGAQTHQPTHLLVEQDHAHAGAPATRQRGLDGVTTEWVAFLDDDDYLYEDHVQACMSWMNEFDADLVYPWFDLKGPNDEDWNHKNPLWVNGKNPFGHPFNDDAIHCLYHVQNFIPITVVARTQLLRDVGGFPLPDVEEGWPAATNEDLGLWKRVIEGGGKIVHAPVRTWAWVWHYKNTSGRGDRW